MVEIVNPMFVTAFTEDHQHEGVNLIESVASHFPNQHLIAFHLGGVDRSQFEKYEMVEFRDFKYSLYPEYVRIVREYRWKPLIIAQALMEFDAIWYMDSSVVFKKGNLSHVHDLINCRRTVTARPPMKSIAERDLRESRTSIERGWDYNLWKQNLAECRKVPLF